MTVVSHSFGCGEWSCHECQNGLYTACIFQYYDSIPFQNCHLSSNNSYTRRKHIFKGPCYLDPCFSENNLWKSSKSEIYPLKSAVGYYIGVWYIHWMRYYSLLFHLESKIQSNFHSSSSVPSSSLVKTSSISQELLVCSWSGSSMAIID